MQALLRAAGRHAAAAAGQVRRMSSGVSHEEEVKQMNLWRNVTIAAIPVCAGVAVWDLSHTHPHHHEGPVYSYMHIRSKEFPWGDCALFDKECWDEKRGSSSGEEH